MKNFYKKGFTLIELLVVIAIIGILASVVLASLNTARAKGADAAIKANLANIRAQAELIYDSEGCYNDGGAGDCTFTATSSCTGSESIFTNTTVDAAIDAAAAASGTGASCQQAANGGAWAISAQLKQTDVVGAGTGADHWCVDSTGASKAIDNAATTTAC